MAESLFLGIFICQKFFLLRNTLYNIMQHYITTSDVFTIMMSCFALYRFCFLISRILIGLIESISVETVLFTITIQVKMKG